METRAYVLLQSADYDVYSAEQLERELSVLESGHAVVDFENVAYIDSTALTRLISALKRMRTKNENSTITLTNVKPAIRRLFELTALNKLFTLE